MRPFVGARPSVVDSAGRQQRSILGPWPKTSLPRSFGRPRSEATVCLEAFNSRFRTEIVHVGINIPNPARQREHCFCHAVRLHSGDHQGMLYGAKGVERMEREHYLLNPGLSRRAALRLLAYGGATALLAACGSTAQPVAPPTSAPPTSAPAAAPTSAAAPAPTSASAPAAAPAATAPASGGAKTGGTLNVGIADMGTDSHDPTLAQPNNPSYVLFEPLLRYDAQGNLVPWLAESWNMSPD